MFKNVQAVLGEAVTYYIKQEIKRATASSNNLARAKNHFTEIDLKKQDLQLCVKS